jgi:CRISPR type I-D-associated protein Csc2
MSEWKSLDEFLKKTALDKPSELPKAKWVQAVLIYETHDYAIFRTEGGEEINTASIEVNGKTEVFPVILGRKLRAIQRRAGHALIRNVLGDQYKCAFKTEEGGVTGLCGSCPECFVRGAAGGEGRDYNIQSRVFYSASYALRPEREATELITLNAVSDLTKQTGKALASQQHVTPEIPFVSVISMYSMTSNEIKYVLKTIALANRLGGRTVLEGLVKPYSVALIGAEAEVVSSLQLAKFLIQNGVKKAEEAVKQLRDYFGKTLKNYSIYDGDFLGEVINLDDSQLITELYKQEVYYYIKSLLDVIKECPNHFVEAAKTLGIAIKEIEESKCSKEPKRSTGR